MKSKITSIQAHKDKKLKIKIKKDLTVILKVLKLTEQALDHYKHYKLVSEILKLIKENTTILKIHENKLEKTTK